MQSPRRILLKQSIRFFLLNLDSAYILSQEWLEEATKANDYFGIVKGNLLLGYISTKKENRGKAVIYFLEGIRQAEKVTYAGVGLDKIWLRRNIANTFRKFEANKLATRYNLEAIKLAEEQGKTNHIIKIKLNQALVYKKDDKHDLAIQLLTEILPLIEDNPFIQSEIINQIGATYLVQGNYVVSKNYFEQVLTLPTDKVVFKIKALHNLGKATYEVGDKERALDYLTQAIDLASENDQNKYNLFMVYQKKGDYLFEMSRKKEALTYLMKAEELVHVAAWNSHSLEIYKTFSSLYYSEGNMELGKQYSDTYFTKIQSYIEQQEDLQKKETKFNFELITKKYFDEVE